MDTSPEVASGAPFVRSRPAALVKNGGRHWSAEEVGGGGASFILEMKLASLGPAPLDEGT